MAMAEDSVSNLSLSLSGGSDELEESSCSRGEEVGPDDIFNILLVGDSGVGKTDLIGRLGEEEFKTKFHATIGKSLLELESGSIIVVVTGICLLCCQFMTD